VISAVSDDLSAPGEVLGHPRGLFYLAFTEAWERFSYYAGLVYFTPVFGSLIADRWTGQRNAVVIGATAMCAGHIAMAFDRTFLAALVLLVVGSGFLKGNVSTQVGALYPGNDSARRSRGFVIFSTGINMGAIAGPLVCGLLAQVYGWHYGFGVAAIFMLVALATYLRGYRYLPARVARGDRATTRLGAADWRIIRVVVAVMGISIFESLAYGQIFNVHPV
jgi:POT family proton-dependent oligopeptide transporter